MKIVAFLLNPAPLAGLDMERYRDDQVYHRDILIRCMTGKRLHEAFNELYYRIHWDNISWVPGKKPITDFAHMKNVFRSQQPELVLCFGNQAMEAIRQLSSSIKFLTPTMQCYHPNAYGIKQQELNNFAVQVRAKMLEIELLGGKNLTEPMESLERNSQV